MLSLTITGLPETGNNIATLRVLIRHVIIAVTGELRPTDTIEMESAPAKDDPKEIRIEGHAAAESADLDAHALHVLASTLGNEVQSLYPRHRVSCSIGAFRSAERFNWP